MQSSDTSANSSARVAVASSPPSWQIDCNGPSAEPACHRRLLSPSSSQHESRINDDISSLHQALGMEHTGPEHKSLGTELFENVTRLDSGETDFPTSSPKWNFRASSSKQHSVGPLPMSAAPPSPSEQKQHEEFDSTAELRHSISPHPHLDIPRSFTESGHNAAEIEQKSFCRVVNFSLV